MQAFIVEPIPLVSAGEACHAPGSAHSRLAPKKHKQCDFFVADILDASLKSDMASMEHPLFALRGGDRRIRVYERNGIKVTIKPGVDGCATIHDKDLWIYCISQLVEAKNRQRETSRIVRFTAYDFLHSTNRDTSGRAYIRLGEMLARLTGTRIETNIETSGRRERGFFGLVDSARIVERDGDGRMVAIEATLPDWLYRSVDTMHVLTLSPDYFRLRKPLDRRIYELARKHCGKQPMWKASIATLHEKSGSADKLFKFRAAIKALVESGELPDYRMAFNLKADDVTFYANGQKGYRAELEAMVKGLPYSSARAREKAHLRRLGRHEVKPRSRTSGCG